MAVTVDGELEYLRRRKLTRPSSHRAKIQIAELCVRGAMIQLKFGMADDPCGFLEDWLPFSVFRGKCWHVSCYVSHLGCCCIWARGGVQET
eukprot:4697510-Pyramimonas_sp.AAC.1